MTVGRNDGFELMAFIIGLFNNTHERKIPTFICHSVEGYAIDSISDSYLMAGKYIVRRPDAPDDSKLFMSEQERLLLCWTLK